jgi:hypothetical protein
MFHKKLYHTLEMNKRSCSDRCEDNPMVSIAEGHHSNRRFHHFEMESNIPQYHYIVLPQKQTNKQQQDMIVNKHFSYLRIEMKNIHDYLSKDNSIG